MRGWVRPVQQWQHCCSCTSACQVTMHKQLVADVLAAAENTALTAGGIALLVLQWRLQVPRGLQQCAAAVARAG